jgi:hypothetical protein
MIYIIDLYSNNKGISLALKLYYYKLINLVKVIQSSFINIIEVSNIICLTLPILKGVGESFIPLDLIACAELNDVIYAIS